MARATAAVVPFVLLSMRLAPPLQAQSTPTPTPTCKVTPFPSATPTCSVADYGCGSPCSPDTTPSWTPSPTPIPDEFQPHDASGNQLSTVLEWRPFIPSGTGPWPTLIVIHGGGFRDLDPFHNNVQQVCQDLRDAGYYTLAVTYPLAPCKVIKGQPCHNDDSSGRPPQQTDAIKAIYPSGAGGHRTLQRSSGSCRWLRWRQPCDFC